jgi:ferredoxin, 2Fe-2S
VRAGEGQVRVLPADVTFTVEAGESVMDAAQRSGYRWPTVCGGNGTCRTCFVLVENGTEYCSAVTDFEAEGIAALAKTVRGEIRLACRLEISGGEITVHKRGVKPAKSDPKFS